MRIRRWLCDGRRRSRSRVVGGRSSDCFPLRAGHLKGGRNRVCSRRRHVERVRVPRLPPRIPAVHLRQGVGPHQRISLASPKSSAVAPAVVAAVLFHSGGDTGNPCPAGLPRQLAARSQQALSTLERSIRIAGGRPVLPSDGAVTPWMAAALLLRLRPSAHDAMRHACSFAAEDLDATTDSSYDGSVVDRTTDVPSPVSTLQH